MSEVIAARTRALPRNARNGEAGFSVVLVVASILILLVLGLAMVSIVVEDSDLSVNQVRSNQAFYAAHAGVEYAVQKLAQNPNWTGLASPGKNVGVGSFWIAPPDGVDENGNPLPAGRLRVVSNGVSNGAARQIQVHVTAGGISTYAGTGTSGYAGDGGAATAARLNDPEGAAAVAANGDLYLADTDNNTIRKVSFTTGIITTVAGNSNPGYTGDGGAATAAKLKTSEDVAIAANGDIYIADTGNHVIRKVTAATGIITTVAGNGSPGATGDGGAATAARLNSPRGIQVAANGDLYIGDRSNEKIRKVTAATGVIITYAGTGTAGYSGDNGAATAARLNHPQGLHLTSAGDLYVADAGNHVIRKISAGGIISTFAGTGTAGYTGNGGLATNARLNAAEAVHLSPSGDLYIADTGNHVIRRVAVGSGIISTIAGTGVAGFAGDGGPASAARFDSPRGLAISPSGVYYVADKNNHRIRRIAGALAVVAWVETRR
ncbi:MAG TPA: NHL repeat-containing protein [Candidatus Eisenbacteria bacterium]|nr:NHL repeat-containing protein [Candidatus Eisenbacteria bacterium]